MAPLLSTFGAASAAGFGRGRGGKAITMHYLVVAGGGQSGPWAVSATGG